MGVCLLGYKKEELDKVKGWDGFIAQDGTFYKVVEKGDMNDVHDEFADIFALNKLGIDLQKLYSDFLIYRPEYRHIRYSNKDIFIHLLGFTNIEHKQNGLEIEPPDPQIAGYKLTDAQFETLMEMFILNRYDIKKLMQVFKYENLGDEVNINRYR